MFIEHLTPQEVTLDGQWQDHKTHSQFSGTLSSSEPFVVLSLLKYGEGYHYMKHRKATSLSVPFSLYQMPFPQDNRYQHTLSITHTVNTGMISEGRLFFLEPYPLSWQAGHLLPFARDAQQHVCIALLAFAKVDVASKRCGIWVVKSHVQNQLEEPWKHILARTRHGYVRLTA